MKSLEFKSATHPRYMAVALFLQAVMGSTQGSQRSGILRGRRIDPANVNSCRRSRYEKVVHSHVFVLPGQLIRQAGTKLVGQAQLCVAGRRSSRSLRH
jgi:hypothetical protein